MRGIVIATLCVASFSMVACGSKDSASPTAPTTGTATVTALTVTGSPTSGSSFQLTATATLSNGTQQNVTQSAAWQSSNPAVATVTAGTVTVIGAGELDVRATYQGATGSMHLLVARLPVTTITISGASASPTFQLTASARLSDGSALDVTRSASWESSDLQIATVSSTGFVTVVGNGTFDVRATYQGMTGTQRLVVALPRTFALSGVVREIAPNVRPVANATVRVLGGTVPSVATNDQGAFSFAALPTGRVLIEVSKDGYVVWESNVTLDSDEQMTVDLYPTPPKDASGAAATARCNDGSWTWAQTAAGACAANGGLAYAVCPGALCAAPATAPARR
jgi:hypothetical protein